MSNPGQDLTLSFDDILGAVKETARGRWFIESLEARTRTGNTTRILDSIARLEDRIEHFGQTGEDAVLVRKARESIALARRDIARLENKPAHMSAEAQLFARLASQAKQAFPQNSGISRALTLVEDLDRELNPQAPVGSESAAPAANLFQPDEAIFEAAPTLQAPVHAPTPEQPKELGAARGARVVIHKLGPHEPESATSASEAAPDPVTEPVAETQPEQAHSRIVIVRRQPGEADAVPLLEEASSSAA